MYPGNEHHVPVNRSVTNVIHASIFVQFCEVIVTLCSLSVSYVVGELICVSPHTLSLFSRLKTPKKGLRRTQTFSHLLGRDTTITDLITVLGYWG